MRVFGGDPDPFWSEYRDLKTGAFVGNDALAEQVRFRRGIGAPIPLTHRPVNTGNQTADAILRQVQNDLKDLSKRWKGMGRQ